MTPPRLCRGGVFVFFGVCVARCVLPDCFVATLLAMTGRERVAMTDRVCARYSGSCSRAMTGEKGCGMTGGGIRLRPSRWDGSGAVMVI